MASRVEVVLYDELEARAAWPGGLYLFTDMERANETECERATLLHQKLQQFPGRVLTLNHPTNHLKRYALLRELFEQGVNEFNVYRATEIADGIRYPVFLRYTDRHIGPLTDLLHSRPELEHALAALVAQGHPLERLLAVEFADTADSRGVFWKYGAFRVGPHVVPGHAFASTNWNAKRESDRRDLVGRTEIEWLRGFPEREQVMSAFNTAQLEYGRMDYAVKDGRIQVWEINDNPSMGTTFFKRHLFARRVARRIARPKRKAAFRDVLRGLDLNAPPLEFQIGAE